MKKFSFLFLASFLICTYCLDAQISLAYSSLMNEFQSPGLINTEEGGYLGLQKTVIESNKRGKDWNDFKHTIKIQRFDKDMHIIQEKELFGESDKVHGEFSQIFKSGNKYLVVYLECGENYGMGNVIAAEIDPVTLGIKRSIIVISSTSLDHKITRLMERYALQFISGVSENAKNLFLMIRMSGSEYYMACIDENMKARWGHKVSDPDMMKMGLCSLVVTDEGDVLMSFYRKKKEKLVYKQFTADGKINDFDVNLPAGSGEAKDLLFHPMKGSNEVLVTGSYMTDDICRGVYKGKLGKNGDLTDFSTTLFPDDLLTKLDKEGWSYTKEKKKGVRPKFRSMPVQLAMNKIGMLIEFFVVTEAKSFFLHGGSIVFVDYSGNVPVFSKVPKYSLSPVSNVYDYSLVSGSGSMFYLINNPKLILFYFDNPENLNRDMALDAKVVNGKNQALVAAFIEKDGTVKRQLIQVLQNEKFDLKPTNDQSVVVPLVIEKKLMKALVRL